MRLHEAAPKLIIQERVGDKVKVSSYWPVPELTRAELALGRLQLSTGGSTPSSFATESWTRRQRLSTIASATSRQRFREFWQTSGLPLDVSREPKPRYDWDTSDSEPEAFENRRGSGGDGQEHSA